MSYTKKLEGPTMSSAPDTPALSVSNLAKSHGALKAVESLSVQVARGEILGLLGPNGAGKTTTLECILGLQRADTGSIHILGLDTTQEPCAARALVGAQLQDETLQDTLSPREALRLFAAFHASTWQIPSLLERFGLEDKADEPFHRLSEGQKRRLFLALAVLHRPVLLVLDEPSAGLDPGAKADLHRLLRELRDEGCGILLSTHDTAEAEQLCGRVGILSQGRLIALDTPAILVARASRLPCLEILTRVPLAEAWLSTLPGATVAGIRGEQARVLSPEPNACVMALARHLEETGNQLLDLSIQRPNLGDLYLELTGQAFQEEKP